jgi:hypothetical protein
MPSNPDALGFEWSDDYKYAPPSGSYSNYLDENGEVIHTLPDGRPCSLHTYNGVFFTSAGEIVTTRDQRAAYNVNTKQYSIVDWERDGVKHAANTYGSMHVYNGSVYGMMNQPYSVYAWNKIADENSNVLHRINVPPAGIYFDGQHLTFRMSDTQIMSINKTGASFAPLPDTHVYSIFDMSTEIWSAANLITGDTPDYVASQEMQGAVFIPGWGNAGSVLRQFSYGTLAGDWYVIDLETNVQRAITLTGSGIPAGRRVGNKMFITEIGGITAMIYVCVNSGDFNISKVFAMRLA